MQYSTYNANNKFQTIGYRRWGITLTVEFRELGETKVSPEMSDTDQVITESKTKGKNKWMDD